MSLNIRKFQTRFSNRFVPVRKFLERGLQFVKNLQASACTSFSDRLLSVFFILIIFLASAPLRVQAADDPIFWPSSAIPATPESFGKFYPFVGDTIKITSMALSWFASNGATGYEYCYDTTNDNACSNWESAGTDTFAILDGLSYATTYFWHVRATDGAEVTYSDGDSTAFWWFKTAHPAPGQFNKSSPANGATNQPASLTLNWTPSEGAASYEYCISADNPPFCIYPYVSTGSATSVNLSGLAYNTTYYWAVRAINSEGDNITIADFGSDNYWSFTTVPPPPPSPFGKVSPSDGQGPLSIDAVTLSWAPSADATNYYYCFDKNSTPGCQAPASWISTDGATSVELAGMEEMWQYYWQVYAENISGTTFADGGTAWWSFTTGAAMLGLDPASLSFGNQLAGTTSAARPVILTNVGSSTLTLGSLSIIGQFKLSNNTCNGASLPASGTCSFKVSFAPTSNGAKTGQVTIPSNDAISPGYLPLNGNGVAGTQILLNPSFETDSNGDKVPNNWAGVNLNPTSDGRNSQIKYLGAYSLKFTGQPAKTKTLTQTINKSGLAGHDFIFTLYNKAQNTPTAGTFRAQVLFYNGKKLIGSRMINFPAGSHAFKKYTLTYTIPQAYTRIVIKLTYGKASGSTWFDAASLMWAP